MGHGLKLITSGCAAMVFMFPLAMDRAAAAEPPVGASGLGGAKLDSKFEELDLKDKFKGFEGSFVLLDCKSGKVYKYNPTITKKRFSPCSTFKIFSALAGLDCGALKGPSDLIKWDGTVHGMKHWNKDHTLKSAVSESVVWYFQKVAERIGTERMAKYLQEVGYGNMDMSGGLTKFWLNSTLQISADEQVEFLRRLVDRTLPFSPSSMNTVAELIEVKKTDAGVLSGKTGTNGNSKHNFFGWFVGYVKHDKNTYAFATNIQAKDGALGRKAREITEQILIDRGLL